MGEDILTRRQRQVLIILSGEPIFIQNFYFTGGTPLAVYYLHHRSSEDLDFFSEVEVDLIWLNSLKGRIQDKTQVRWAEIQQSFNRNLLQLHFGDGILKAEFTYYPFKPIEPPKMISGLKVDSLKDIAVNKFFTIYQKPSARHFIDLYLILKLGEISWEELQKLARIKFDTNIDPLQLGGQLITAETLSDLPRMVVDLDESEWRDYFLQKAKELKNEFR